MTHRRGFMKTLVGAFVASAIEIRLATAPVLPVEIPETVELPLYGKIAGGTPIEALRNPTEHMGFPAAMLGSGEHYALTIDGDSMIDAGINDGDTVVMASANTRPPFIRFRPP